MIEIIVICWWGAYIGALSLKDENEQPKRWAMNVLGYLSVGFAFLFAESIESYLASAIILAGVHFLFHRKVTTIFALLLIFLGYVIKFS